MTLPSAFNPISLGQIQTEFGGSNPIALAGEYYRNGSYVTSNNTNVPTSGTIKFSDFYGSRRAIFGCTDSSASNYNSSATDNDGSCSYPPPPCVPTTLNTTYAKFTYGYVSYVDGTRGYNYFFNNSLSAAYSNYLPTKSAYSYGSVQDHVQSVYRGLGRPVEQAAVSSTGASWVTYFDTDGFGNRSTPDLNSLTEAITTTYNSPGGEREQVSNARGRIGTFDECGNSI
jgi:hypothetical protein